MRKYFSQIYHQTGKKPFTWLNCWILLFIPLIIFFAVGIMSENLKNPIIFGCIALLIGIIVNIFIHIKKFGSVKQALLLTLINILASVWVLFSMVIVPAFSAVFKALIAMFSGHLSSRDYNNPGSVNHQSTRNIKNMFNYDFI